MAEAFDVIVAGGGPGGSAAAIAAARMGARVLLVERYGFLGGMATAGLVNPFMRYAVQHPETGESEIVTAGLFVEVLDELRARNAMCGVSFDEEVMKLLLDDMTSAAGVHLRLHSLVVGAEMSERRVTGLETQGKSGRQVLHAKVFVDSTGDGDLAALAGAPFEIGRPEDGLAQAMTTCFNMAGVDTELLLKDGFAEARDQLTAQFLAAQERGRMTGVLINRFRFHVHPRPGVLHFNVTRVQRKMGTSAQDLSDAEFEAREQIRQIVDWLCEEVAPFRDAWLQKVAAQIGVRETRRIMGDYVMTGEDILEARHHDDAILRGCFGIDIHSPTGRGCGGGAPKAGQAYEVPYRAITPRGVENLLMGCRAISSTHEAHAAVRTMPQMFALGDAAGVAAAMAARGDGNVRSVDVPMLQATLVAQGANLRQRP